MQDNPFEQSAFGRRTAADLFGVSAWVATAEEIILHKLYWSQITPSERQLQDAGSWSEAQTSVGRRELPGAIIWIKLWCVLDCSWWIPLLRVGSEAIVKQAMQRTRFEKSRKH